MHLVKNIYGEGSKEDNAAAVPEPAGAMVLGVMQLVGLWWLMTRRAGAEYLASEHG